MSKTQRGFTLIELMMALAVLAILTSISLPSFRYFVSKQKLATGQADLSSLAMNMENYLQNNTAYPSTAASINSTSALKTTLPGWTPAGSTDFGYAVTAVSNVAAPPTYTLTATGASSALTGCTITLSSGNARTMSGCPGGASTW